MTDPPIRHALPQRQPDVDRGNISQDAASLPMAAKSPTLSLLFLAARARNMEKVAEKMKRIPHNGRLEVWLQRVTKAKGVGVTFESLEPICQIVNGDKVRL